MIRHWDVWYTQGSASHPFYQKIKLNEETQELELDGDAVDLLLKKELSSPPIEGGSDQFSISYDGKLLAFSVHTKNREMAWTTKWDIYLIDLTAENPLENYNIISQIKERIDGLDRTIKDLENLYFSSMD